MYHEKYPKQLNLTIPLYQSHDIHHDHPSIETTMFTTDPSHETPNPISRRGLTVAGPPALRRSQGATGPSSNQVGTDLNGFFRWEMISIWESNRDYHEHGDLMVISW